jgi:hypothetical protein
LYRLKFRIEAYKSLREGFDIDGSLNPNKFEIYEDGGTLTFEKGACYVNNDAAVFRPWSPIGKLKQINGNSFFGDPYVLQFRIMPTTIAGTPNRTYFFSLVSDQLDFRDSVFGATNYRNYAKIMMYFEDVGGTDYTNVEIFNAAGGVDTVLSEPNFLEINEWSTVKIVRTFNSYVFYYYDMNGVLLNDPLIETYTFQDYTGTSDIKFSNADTIRGETAEYPVWGMHDDPTFSQSGNYYLDDLYISDPIEHISSDIISIDPNIMTNDEIPMLNTSLNNSFYDGLLERYRQKYDEQLKEEDRLLLFVDYESELIGV